MKKILALLLAVALAANLFACSSSNNETSEQTSSTEQTSITETYTASADGYNGAVTLTISVADNIIESIDIEHDETAGLGGTALDSLKDLVLSNQTLQIDTISGATLSSDAFMIALEDCLVQAGFDIEYLKTNAVFEQAADEALETELVIVGGGLSGLTTALQAAGEGINIIIVERAGVLGGATLTAGGYFFGVDTNAQAEQNIIDSVDIFMELVSVTGNGNNDLDFARMIAEQSGPAADWLIDELGLEIKEEIGVGLYTPHNVDRVYTAEGGGSAMINVITDKLEQFVSSGQVQILMNTEAHTLLVDGNERVIGIEATGQTGNTVTVNADYTVLATGGYGYNEELLNKYQFENVITNSPVSNTGMGFQMLEELGSELIILQISGQAGAIPNNGFDKGYVFNTSSYPGVIWTDISGNRIADEMSISTVEKNLLWKNAEENTVYMIFSEDMISADNPLFVGMNSEDNMEILTTLIEEGFVISANSIEELASIANLDNLTQTLELYNNDCATGVDSEFGKTQGLIEFDSDNYYAIKTYPWIVQTSDGIKSNIERQPLRTDDTVIEGVYVVGDMTGATTLTGGTAIGGAGLTPALTTGIQVAEQIAKELGKYN